MATAEVWEQDLVAPGSSTGPAARGPAFKSCLGCDLERVSRALASICAGQSEAPSRSEQALQLGAREGHQYVQLPL